MKVRVIRVPEINSGFASCYVKFPNKIRVLRVQVSGYGFFCLALMILHLLCLILRLFPYNSLHPGNLCFLGEGARTRHMRER
jgi:hypothetical protein